jgi:hypothetical protein
MSRGAEEIFESVGTGVEVESPSARVIESNNEDMDRVQVTAKSAFEVFAGKVYLSPGQSEKWRNEDIYSAADSSEAGAESPLQRFTRLRSELSQLQSDLTVMTNDEASREQQGASSWGLLQKETEKILMSVNSLAVHKALDPNAKSRQLSANELSDLVSNLSVGETEVAVDSKINSTSSSSLASVSDLSSLEARVFGLESLLGSTANVLDMESLVASSEGGGVGNSSGRKANFPLIDCLSRLERRVEKFDERFLESLRSKATTVRSELEAMNRERTRGATSAEQKAIDAASRVEDLHERARRVESLVTELPALLVRLQTLDSTHRTAALFAQRIDVMEQAVQGATSLVADNAEILKTLRGSITSIIELFKGNVEKVETLLSNL